jgi:hypothetical protein
MTTDPIRRAGIACPAPVVFLIALLIDAILFLLFFPSPWWAQR